MGWGGMHCDKTKTRIHIQISQQHPQQLLAAVIAGNTPHNATEDATEVSQWQTGRCIYKQVPEGVGLFPCCLDYI
jgi:hypothetical protein